jgi:hypothetical protein
MPRCCVASQCRWFRLQQFDQLHDIMRMRP